MGLDRTKAMDTQKKMQEILFRVIILGIVLGSLFCMLYFGTKKNGYHVDEIYSYGLSNSGYLPFMHFGYHDYTVKDWMKEYGTGESMGELVSNLVKDFRILKEADFDLYHSEIYRDYLIAQANSADTKSTTWVSGDDYLHYIAVSPENTFNYASVYYNQRGDVHPPLFYMILHTVCSVFQGSFSKWYGLGINMIFMLLTMGVLYKMCVRFCGGKISAVAILAMYGFSGGFITTVMFIRMYAMLTFFVVTDCYLHLKMAEKGFGLKKRERCTLGMVTILGFLTHYYFVIYAIGIALVACIRMMMKKNWRQMTGYVLTMAASAGIGLCAWPFAIKHVFFGYRGRGSLEALTQWNVYLIKIKLMMGQIFGPMLGGKWWLWLGLPVLVIVIALVAKKSCLNWERISFIMIPAFLYVIFVAQMVPYYTDRYVMCVYPFVCMVFVGSLYYIFEMACDGLKRKVWGGKSVHIHKYKEHFYTGLMVLAVCVFLACGSCFVSMPGYMYPEGQELVQVPANTDCVFVLPDGDWNESAEDSSILAKCRKIGVVYESALEILKEEYTYQSGDYLMVCVQKNMDVEQVLQRVRETLGTNELIEVSRTNGGSAVRILLTDR